MFRSMDSNFDWLIALFFCFCVIDRINNFGFIHLYNHRVINFLKTSHVQLMLKALYSEQLERLRPPMNKVLEKTEPLFLKNTTCRNVFGWSIPEDFLRAAKSLSMSVSK